MNWEKFREYYDKLSSVEKKMIRKLFSDFVKTHKLDNDLSQPELEQYYLLFEAGWITSQIIGE